MKIGLGGLRYPPDVFWALSFVEFMAAAEGYAESKGVRTGGGGPPLTGADLEELEAEYPDTPNTRHGRDDE